MIGGLVWNAQGGGIEAGVCRHWFLLSITVVRGAVDMIGRLSRLFDGSVLVKCDALMAGQQITSGEGSSTLAYEGLLLSVFQG